MVVRRIGVLSLGKILGVIYAVLGLLLGGLFAVFSLFGAAMGMAQGQGNAWMGAFFGVGAVVFMPLLYGFFGFLGGIIVSAVYNAASSVMGGIELELSGVPATGAGGARGGRGP